MSDIFLYPTFFYLHFIALFLFSREHTPDRLVFFLFSVYNSLIAVITHFTAKMGFETSHPRFILISRKMQKPWCEAPTADVKTGIQNGIIINIRTGRLRLQKRDIL